MRKELNGSLALAVLLLGAACVREAPPGRDYIVRAQVVKPPDPVAGLYLYHEAIDDWRGRAGEVEGMDPMSMPFPVAEDVALAGIEANDKVEVKLHVDWSAETPVEITGIRELPQETQLVFREAKPPRKP
jgi:hypothetical protein